jgi:hypothetical protein
VVTLLRFFGRGTLIGCAALLVLGSLLTGCKKKTPEITPAADAASATGNPTAGYDEARVKADLEDMNKLLRAYVQATKAIPKSVDELVSRGFVRALPSPPPGKAYAIQMQPFGYQVVLVDN